MTTRNTQNKIELAKLTHEKFLKIADLVKTLIIVGGFIYAIRIILDGLVPLISHQTPEGIKAISLIIKEFNLGSLLALAYGGVMTAAWAKERKGKKRAIELKSEYQKRAEQYDAYRSTTDLTSEGNTPVKRRSSKKQPAQTENV